MRPDLFVSNDLSVLAQNLHESLSNSTLSFRKIVIVSTSMQKEFLTREFAALDKEVTTGFKVFSLYSAIDYLLHMVSFEDKNRKTVPSSLLLSLQIETILYSFLESREIIELEELLPLEDRSSKIGHLSQLLAQEFLDLGLYGAGEIQKFVENKTWKSAIWEEVFEKWDFPYKAFQNAKVKNPDNWKVEIHIFGFSHMPKIFQRFFTKLEPFFALRHYLFNPCREYWGDIVSEKERLYLREKFKEKNVEETELLELEGYLKSRNILLAHFSGGLKPLFHDFLDKEANLIEEYVEVEKKSLLCLVKEDIFSLQENRKEPLELKEDGSILIHSAPSRKREIESLYELLLEKVNLTDTSNSDILVFAPDISLYFPAIYEVFGASDSVFSIKIADLPLLTQSSYLRGALELFSLKDTRWEIEDLLKLFSNPCFAKALQLNEESLQKTREIFQKANVCYGYNIEHKKELLQSDHAKAFGTWKYALERILLGLFVAKEEVEIEGIEFYPHKDLSMTDAELLGQLIDLMENLYQISSVLQKQEKTLIEWADFSESFLEKYLSKEEDEQGALYFSEQLKTLVEIKEEQKVPFSSVQRFFQKAFEKKNGAFMNRPSSKETLIFADLGVDKIYPAKIIALIGVQEGSFPKKPQHFPLREVDQKQMDFSLTNSSKDRITFLQAILHAKESLIFSYCNLDPSDNKAISASLFIQEFLQYVDGNYKIGERKVSSCICKTEEMLSFSQENLSRSFSSRLHALAKSYYLENKQGAVFFSENRKGLSEIALETDLFITIKELDLFAKNPLRYFFNKKLGIYLQDREEKQVGSEFLLSALDKSILKDKAVKEGLEKVWECEKVLGNLPDSIFEKLALTQLQEEVEEALSAREKFSLSNENSFQIRFDLSLKTGFYEKGNTIVLPAIKIQLQQKAITIYGDLEEVSDKGFVIKKDDSIASLAKVWPKILLFSLLPDRFEKKLLFLEKEKSKEIHPDTLLHIEEYFSFFLQAAVDPCPLSLDFLESLLTKSEDEFKEEISKTFSQTFESKYIDPYSKWMKSYMKEEQLKVKCLDFAPLIKEAFKGLLHFSSKGSHEKF